MWSGTSVREIIGEGPRAEVHRFTFAPAPCRPGGVFAPLRRWREVIGDGVLTRGMGRLTPRGETFSAEGLSLRRTDLLVEVGRLEHGVGMPLEAQVLAICNRTFFGSSTPHRPTIRPTRPEPTCRPPSCRAVPAIHRSSHRRSPHAPDSWPGRLGPRTVLLDVVADPVSEPESLDNAGRRRVLPRGCAQQVPG